MTQINFTKTPSKIIGIQFSILSPEEIRNNSVAEIVNRETYINNKPVINGLFDPRMGVLEPGIICPTDGLDYMKTPGYFGHIELAKPLFYVQYLSTILKVIRSTCIKCGNLLIQKENNKNLLELTPEERWSNVYALASKVKRCGEQTDNGCGCLQPSKIKKEGLSNLIAEWDSTDGSDTLTLSLTPEIVLKQFKRISDDDVEFMGFSSKWSRPDWMVCQVLAVPPPAVRPSVKHDSQQRSEDDISHIIVNIIKANKTLQDKIQSNAPENIINDWTTVLQYYVATLVDNKIPGVAAMAQRSGRPLKSVKERIVGKTGRVRGNLMGKRVDYSARSVITPDPNLSIRELGIPLKIAKNITSPIVVNERNKKFLLKLVHNGPDEWPGAKILVKSNGDNISLRYVDRESIELENGDVVHRHMLNGDSILFNRQPTLHRMSMMCHIAKIMPVGDTFRMNVADTKPYNADFDGDEMNLHMPQDNESESELLNLAAVPWQIVSPANNKPIVGIFQDSLLGIHRFTRENIQFTQRETMNLLMTIKNIDLSKINEKDSFNILSQILPPLSLKYKTKKFKEEEDEMNSNNVLEIKNGVIKRGHIEKGVLGDGSKGLLHRICNDFGNMRCSEFIDDLQNMVTEYMKTSSYSVGISDLIADIKTNEKISDIILEKKKDVKLLIDKTHLGLFENKSGKDNVEVFETEVNNILGKALSDAGNIGLNSLDKDNRFVIMVNAGSKGSEINISQMISCLGQQQVDGKRVPYGFEDRTLPHYTKYDDTPGARGFVENSFISGLTPQELFFHAMGGRIGLIDTAVKTSQTGYIQRRLVKGMEDIKVEYDLTVRNNKNKIIQYSYGGDSFDTVKLENQNLPLLKQSIEEIYKHFNYPTDKEELSSFKMLFETTAKKRLTRQLKELNKRCKLETDIMIDKRNIIIEDVNKNEEKSGVCLPISYNHLIQNIKGQFNITKSTLIDITPNECYELIDMYYEKIKSLYYVVPSDMFKINYYYNLAPFNLFKHRLHKTAIVSLLEQLWKTYKQSLISPGEMVGLIAAQSIGEPTTQMTLNTFHFAGVASKSNVTRGVPRIEEILSLSENPKNPSCTLYLHPHEQHDKENALRIMNRVEHSKLREVVSEVDICYDPRNEEFKEDSTLLEQFNEFEKLMDECESYDAVDDNYSKWVIRIHIDKEELLERELTMDDIHFAIMSVYKDEINCIYSDFNDDNLVFRIRMRNQKKKIQSLDQQDEIYKLKNFQEHLLDNLVLRGIVNISKVIPRKVMNTLVLEDDKFVKKESWVLDTVGTNLTDILGLEYIDTTKTYTNDIREIYRVLGIEAARQSIFNEISEVIEFDNTYINYHHISLLCDRMTCNDKMVSIFRHGINNDDIGPIAKASFEETPEMFFKAARHAELDNLRGVSANVMCGQEGYFGTSSFKLMLDMEDLTIFKSDRENKDEDEIDFGDLVEDKICNSKNLSIQTNVNQIKKVDLGQLDDYDMEF